MIAAASRGRWAHRLQFSIYVGWDGLKRGYEREDTYITVLSQFLFTVGELAVIGESARTVLLVMPAK